MIWFRHVDRRYPFLWETADQPPGRWHGAGQGPVQYLASTPDGAWAEFLRREEITDPADLDGIERALWAVDIDRRREVVREPQLPRRVLTGGLETYAACRAEARKLRDDGATAVSAPSAALVRSAARGQRVSGGLREADARDGRVLAVFGSRPNVRGWACCSPGRPSARLLPLVRHFGRARTR